QTQTGLALLRAISDAGRWKGKECQIIPYISDDGDDDDAYAEPVDGWSGRHGAPEGAKLYEGGRDDPSTPYDDRGVAKGFWHGTGKGSNVELHYNPERKDAAPNCPRDGSTVSGPCKLLIGADHDKDDQLLHELVHAMREMRGELTQIPTENKEWDNQEEFFAI